MDVSVWVCVCTLVEMEKKERERRKARENFIAFDPLRFLFRFFNCSYLVKV